MTHSVFDQDFGQPDKLPKVPAKVIAESDALPEGYLMMIMTFSDSSLEMEPENIANFYEVCDNMRVLEHILSWRFGPFAAIAIDDMKKARRLAGIELNAVEAISFFYEAWDRLETEESFRHRAGA